MKRSRILQILAKRLSGRDVEDIERLALAEMSLVQKAVLEHLPNQPWFLETEVFLPLLKEETSTELPSDYNGLMTHGGVWISPATILKYEYLTTQLYPVEALDSIYSERPVQGNLDAGIRTVFKEQELEESLKAQAPTFSFTSLREILKEYEDVESLAAVAPQTSTFSLREILKEYEDVESLEAQAPSASAFELNAIVINYTETEDLQALAPSVSGVILNVNV